MLYLLLLLFVSACTNKDFHGYYIRKVEVSKVKTGFPAEKVSKILGSPTLIRGDKWYYIGRNYSQTSFFPPENNNQEKAIVKFDKNKKVEWIKYNQTKAAKDMDFLEVSDNTYGDDKNFLERLIHRKSKKTS